MKNYKVGDRVWWTTYKILCEVADIKYSENGTPFEWIIDTPGFKGNRFDLFRIKEITQTADSMFEALGYEKSTNSAYAKYHKHNIKITFVNDVNGKMVSGVPAIVTPQLHQAIHKKLIELGWIE